MIPLLPNSSFSERIPWLQLAVDSTSLGEFKICPRRYYYSIILGYRTAIQSVHLTFGIILHSAVEKYHQKRAEGKNHEYSLEIAVQKTLLKSWDHTLQRPLAELSVRPDKNRLTLLRSVVWYLDQFGENDPIKTITLSNGKAAVELSFRFALQQFSALTGEPYLLCGHIDRLGEFANAIHPCDIKTTGHELNEEFFAQFTPDNQQSLYIASGDIVYALPIKAAIIDGIRVTSLRTEFKRGLVQRSEYQLDEWLRDTGKWITKMEDCAIAAKRDQHKWSRAPSLENIPAIHDAAHGTYFPGPCPECEELKSNVAKPGASSVAPPPDYWEMNDKACGIYGGCPYREVCSKSTPGAREDWLKAKYTRRVWDPLQVRGDI